MYGQATLAEKKTPSENVFKNSQCLVTLLLLVSLDAAMESSIVTQRPTGLNVALC